MPFAFAYAIARAMRAVSCVAMAVNPPAESDRSTSLAYAASTSRLLGIGELGRLEVRALDETEVRGEVEKRLEIAGRAVEVRLEHGADVLVALLAQAPVDTERCVDERRLLHVEAHEVPEPRCVRHQLADVRACELLVESETEVGELQRDVDAQLLGGDAIEDLPVALDDDPRLGLVAHTLAEQRRVAEKPLVVEPSQHDDGLVERLPRDETCSAETHAVPAHTSLHAGALGCGEDRLSQHFAPPVSAPVRHRVNSTPGRHSRSG